MSQRIRTIANLAVVSAFVGTGAACVKSNSPGDTPATTTNVDTIVYAQILDGTFETVFFDNLPALDGPNYLFANEQLAAVVGFFGDGEVTLDFRTKAQSVINLDGIDVTVSPGTSRVVRGGAALGFHASVSGDKLTDTSKDFLAHVDVGDTVEIESGTGIGPGMYTVTNLTRTQLTLDHSAGDSGQSMNVTYVVRNGSDSVIVRFNLDVFNPDGSVRYIEVGMLLDFSYDGQSLVGLFNATSVTTLDGVVIDTPAFGDEDEININIVLRKVANTLGTNG